MVFLSPPKGEIWGGVVSKSRMIKQAAYSNSFKLIQRHLSSRHSLWVSILSECQNIILAIVIFERLDKQKSEDSKPIQLYENRHFQGGDHCKTKRQLDQLPLWLGARV